MRAICQNRFVEQQRGKIMALPEIKGNVIRRVCLNYCRNGSNKDYQITISSDDENVIHVYSEYGPARQLRDGKEWTEENSLYRANEFVNRLIRSKTMRGYGIVREHDMTKQFVASVSRPTVKPESASARSRISTADLPSSIRKLTHYIF
jgi:hypothetical protein